MVMLTPGQKFSLAVLRCENATFSLAQASDEFLFTDEPRQQTITQAGVFKNAKTGQDEILLLKSSSVVVAKYGFEQ